MTSRQNTLSAMDGLVPNKRLINFTLIVGLVALQSTLAVAIDSSPSFLSLEAISSSSPHTGPIADASCNVEQLEDANDSQLYTILQDLKNTSFFRSFAVDVDSKCPIATWGKPKLEDKPKPAHNAVPPSFPFSTEPGDDSCQGLPDYEFGQPPPCELSEEDSEPVPVEVEEEEEFECDGGSIGDEMEEDAEPLCHLAHDDDEESEFSTPFHDMFSKTLNTINNKMGWESEDEERTFNWSKPSSPVVTVEHDTDCDDEEEGKLPDSFWLDMCSNITLGDGMKVVNLIQNPERNTGYNGTHIWRAIYEENCIDDMDDSMCYEERVLYKLLSGLHASTTLSIAKNYYPPNKKKGRDKYEPNSVYFYEQFADHPDYIRNLHFSYVVLLRALKKAAPILYNYQIRTGDIVEDETASILLNRLLDSSILSSCNNVFSAFDESLMFRSPSTYIEPGMGFNTEQAEELVSLQKNFKGVFHNISSILDCVQCQQCKLHGKMSMLGYGSALKILFLPTDQLNESVLERNEVVALINTIAKMSEAIKEVRELTHLYWTEKHQTLPSDVPNVEIVNKAIGVISELFNDGLISEVREAELIEMAFEYDSNLFALVKHYGSNPMKFLKLLDTILDTSDTGLEPDAIVIGTGLAGLSATLNILDRGGKVLLIEKEHRLGGNSNKASSGINACCPTNGTDDTVESFMSDTTRSAGSGAQPDLIKTLIENSASAVTWLKNRVGVDLSLLAQLGGHDHKRTHRPSNGMVGAEIIYGMQRAVKEYEKSGMVQIMTDTKVTNLVKSDEGAVIGVNVEYLSQSDERSNSTQFLSQNVILATGGFASDRSSESYLSKYRPELMRMPATAGEFSTGDGVKLGTSVGAGLVDMDKVQIHPTGWVDPKDPNNPNKILSAELMRGVGGILLNKAGERFCNELGTRAYVTDMMLGHDPHYVESKIWNVSTEVPTFSLVLSSSAAQDGKKHVDHYTHKGLLTKIEGVKNLAKWMKTNEEKVRESLTHYRIDAESGVDKWGKTTFRGLPQADFSSEVFYAGTVTPVLHYCMGGITIDTEGNVLDGERNIIPGLHAAGEVSGGVHGNNRLGGNSLLECTVFGTIVGKKIPVKNRLQKLPNAEKKLEEKSTKTKEVTMDELALHNTPEDCWVAIHGFVYDLTDFAEEHPAGFESIQRLGGQDGTLAFASVHSKGMMDDFEDEKIGIFVENH